MMMMNMMITMMLHMFKNKMVRKSFQGILRRHLILNVRHRVIVPLPIL